MLNLICIPSWSYFPRQNMFIREALASIRASTVATCFHNPKCPWTITDWELVQMTELSRLDINCYHHKHLNLTLLQQGFRNKTKKAHTITIQYKAHSRFICFSCLDALMKHSHLSKSELNPNSTKIYRVHYEKGSPRKCTSNQS